MNLQEYLNNERIRQLTTTSPWRLFSNHLKVMFQPNIADPFRDILSGPNGYRAISELRAVPHSGDETKLFEDWAAFWRCILCNLPNQGLSFRFPTMSEMRVALATGNVNWHPTDALLAEFRVFLRWELEHLKDEIHRIEGAISRLEIFIENDGTRSS